MSAGVSPTAGPVARRRWRTAALAVVVAGYAWLGGGFRSFTWQATAATAAGAAAIVIFAWRCRSHRFVVPANRMGLLIWSAWLAAVIGWESWAFAGQPRAQHPTLSSIADALTDTRPGRAAALLAWIVLGWWLARLRPAPGEAVSPR
jgi:hypothetical protein